MLIQYVCAVCIWADLIKDMLRRPPIVVNTFEYVIRNLLSCILLYCCAINVNSIN